MPDAKEPTAREAWAKRYDEMIKTQPEECTRRRAKPHIDDCGCQWCGKFDEVMADYHQLVHAEDV